MLTFFTVSLENILIKMKKLILLLSLVISFAYEAHSQTINYQAAIRDAGGNLVTNQAVGAQIKILQGSASGTLIYTETHNVTSNNFGLINLKIGEGTTTGNFSTINWSTQNYWLELAIDITGGTNYQVMGSSQLSSVPYANYALNGPDSDPTNEIELPTGGTNGQVLTTSGSGSYSWTDKTAADNLGNHIATTNIQLNGNKLSNDGTNKGISLINNGAVTVDADAVQILKLNGTTTGTATYLEVNNKVGTRALFGPDGNGFSGGSTDDVAVANWSNGNLTFFTNATEKMRIDKNGNIGIGKTTPNSKLNVKGAVRIDNGGLRVDAGGVRIDAGGNALTTYGANGSVNVRLREEYANAGGVSTYNPSGAERFATFIDTNTDVGAVFTYGPSSSNFLIGNLSGHANNGFAAVANATSVPVAGMYVDANGKGVIYGNIKNFRMNHPRDASKEIWYASLEGPEAGAYARGTAKIVNGNAVIQFPEHYKETVNEATITLYITPNSSNSKGLAVIAKNVNQFQVKELMNGKGNYSFDWVAFGVRKGFEDFQVVRDKKNMDFMKKGNKTSSSLMPSNGSYTNIKKPLASNSTYNIPSIQPQSTDQNEVNELRQEIQELKKLVNTLMKSKK